MDNRKDFLLKKIKNDKARAQVQALRKQAEQLIETGGSGDKSLEAYKIYRKKFNELMAKYPGWDRLIEPIPYSDFLLDYNENIYAGISRSDRSLSGLTPPEVYALRMHGVNENSISILQTKLLETETDPIQRNLWQDPKFFNSHITEAFARLRELIPDDKEYDEVFSPKESVIYAW